MKRALRVGAVVILAAVALVAVVALAGPRARANLVVSPTTVVTHSITDVPAASGGVATVLFQCPQGAVWYKTLNAAELAGQDGGLPMYQLGDAGWAADGGFFGVLVDFRNQGDPMPVVRDLNNEISAAQVAIAFVGISDAGATNCGITTP